MRAPTTPQAVTLLPVDAPDEPDAIALRPGPASSKTSEQWFALSGRMMVRNVVQATLTPFLPAKQTSNAAVIVAAGGGYLIESLESEAWAQARWLADRGIAAFALKYRLQSTPVDEREFGAALIERFKNAAAQADAGSSFDVPTFMIDDASAAIRLVRARAAEWSIDPHRVGYLGFSAGAMIGLDLVDGADDKVMPDFLGAVYPSMAVRRVRRDAPPLFAAMAADDQLYGRQGYGLVDSWRQAGGSIELHVYAAGGHGFGMGISGTTSTGLMDAFYAWLACGGWLDDSVTRNGR